MLVSMGEMLRTATTHKYAVGAFDVPNLEAAEAVLEAAVEANSPVIVAIPEHFYRHVRLESLVNCIREQAIPLEQPVALILDHGNSYEGIVRAIRAGMTSVMFDGSALPYSENVRITREVVKVAHAVGVSVEAEIGHVIRDYDREIIEEGLTDPEEARRFVQDTGVDALAVAVGTAHGHYRGEPKIHYDLLATIRETAGVPLVLHGGSSTGDERLKRSVEYGVAKVNIYTDMSTEAKHRFKSALEERWDKVRYNDLIDVAKGAFRDVAGHYIRLFGSAGRG